jgi:hypothetical protein
MCISTNGDVRLVTLCFFAANIWNRNFHEGWQALKIFFARNEEAGTVAFVNEFFVFEMLNSGLFHSAIQRVRIK